MAVIKGDEGDNVLIGTRESDSLSGFGGSDKLYGLRGNDELDGGEGADEMFGRFGDDTYWVDDENDRVAEFRGEGFADMVISSIDYRLPVGVENLILIASAIAGRGNSLDNRMVGNDGDNRLDGGEGADTMEGGRGDDTYVLRGSPEDRVIEFEGEGTDAVILYLASATQGYTLAANLENVRQTGDAGTIFGNDAANYIIGSSFADDLRGGVGDDVLVGLDGFDSLVGGAGADLMRGGTGGDTYTVDNAGDRVLEWSDEGNDVVLSSVSYTLSGNIERLDLSAGGIRGVGNRLANRIVGNSERNILDGRGGDDVMEGGFGNDDYYVSSTKDVVIDTFNGGHDRIFSSSSFQIAGSVEDLFLIGTVSTNGYGNSNINRIVGNEAANSLYGGDGWDQLAGGDGDDKLYGGDGRDTLEGGAGADGFYFDDQPDGDRILDFAPADDTIFLSRARFNTLVVGTLDVDAFHEGTVAQDAEDRIIYNRATGEIYFDGDGNGRGTPLLLATVTPETDLTHADFVVY
ncbi:MAG TPA: calcium-binding protein [Allosphingosinicella sp.]|jgi:Ca2+-binding RTX toxin-like protein